MRKRPTRRTLVVAGVGGVLVIAASTAQAGWLFVLSAGVFALLIASFVARTGLSGAELRVTVGREALTGDETRYVLELRNRGRRTLPAVRLEDGHPAFSPVALVAEPLAPGASSRVEIVRPAVARGEHSNAEVMLQTGAPFGFTRSRREMSPAAEISVLPRVVELSSFPILEPASFPAESLHERARTGAGQDYLGVREYRRGDPLRYVHWRSTARAGRLVVREYEEPARSRVLLVLSGPDAGEPPDSAFEVVVSACASVAAYALHTGHPVEIVRPGADGPERIGEVGARSALGWLAGAAPRDSDLLPLLNMGLTRVSRRGTVVFFVPTQGRAYGELPDAMRAVQAVGARAIAVVARSSTWSGRQDDAALPATLASERALVRVVEKGKELGRCLQG